MSKATDSQPIAEILGSEIIPTEGSPDYREALTAAYGHSVNTPLGPDQVQAALRDLADERLAQRRFTDYLSLFSSHQATAALQGIQDPEEFVIAARDTWERDDQPSANIPFWREALRICRVRPELFMSLDEREALAALPPTVEVFRGCGPREYVPKGFAWTLDRDKAEFFAFRYSRGGRAAGHVFRAEVQRRNAIAYLSGRRERELLFFPQAVRGWHKL